jgi:hypothetical protein
MKTWISRCSGGEVDEKVSHHGPSLVPALNQVPCHNFKLHMTSRRAHTPSARPISIGCLSRPAARLYSRQGLPRPSRASVHRQRPAARDSELHRDSGCLSFAIRRADDDSADWDVARALRRHVRNFHGAYASQAVRGLRMGHILSVRVSASLSLALHSEPLQDHHSGVHFPFFPWKYLFLSTT